MANNVIIIGGTCKLDKFIDELEDQLIELAHIYCPIVDRVEVLDLTLKGISPIDMSWVGATVIPKLEMIKDLWITRNRWIGTCIGED